MQDYKVGYLILIAALPTICDRRPGGARSWAVKTNLIGRNGLEFFELHILLRSRDTNLTLAGSRDGTVVADIPRVLMAKRSGHSVSFFLELCVFCLMARPT